jgi:integrase
VSTKKKLTSISAEALRPRAKRYEVADAASPLRLLVLPSGHKSFILRYRRPDGRTAKLTLGRFDPSAEMTGDAVIGAPMTLGAARQLAAECLREKARGDDPAGLVEKARVEAAKAATLGEVLPDYLSDLAERNRSHAATARNLTGLVTPWLTRPLSSITPDDCWTFVQRARTHGITGLEVRHKGPRESRARLAHSLLGGLFTWCVAKRKLKVSPMAGLEAPVAANARDRVLDDNEINIFWRATEALSVWHRSCLRLLLLTGARVREISELRRDEIKGDTLKLSGARTKNKKAHTIPLSAQAREVLGTMPHVLGCDYVFSMGRVPISNWHRVKGQLDAEMRRMGWNGEPWRVHDLRRTAATLLARLGTAIHVTEKLLNHTSGKLGGLVGVYQRYEYEPECREAVEKLGAEVSAILAKPSAVAPAETALAA